MVDDTLDVCMHYERALDFLVLLGWSFWFVRDITIAVDLCSTGGNICCYIWVILAIIERHAPSTMSLAGGHTKWINYLLQHSINGESEFLHH
jgi:hypothetical protein